MIIPFIEKYLVDSLLRPTLNLSKFYSPIDGWIRRARVIAPNTSFGTHVFNLQKNGVYLYPTISAWAITANAAAEKTELSIAIAKGDVLTWDLISVGAGFVGVPVYFEIDIEPADLPGRRETISFTSASLANLATDNVDLELGKSGFIWKATADRSARLRLYDSAAYRTADAARPIGTDPEGEHGLQMDIYFPPANLTWDLATMIPFKDAQATPTGIVKAAIENRSGSTSTVDLDFEVIQFED